MASEDTEKILNQAGQAIRAGKKAEARKMLEQILETDDGNEQAWLMLAAVVDTPRERRICLENVLEINPDNEKAKQALEKLRPSPASGANLAPSAPPRTAPTVNSAATPRAPKQPPVTVPTKRAGETTQGAADAWRSQRNRGGLNPTFVVIGLVALAALGVGFFLASGGLNPPTITLTPSLTVQVVVIPSAIPTATPTPLRGVIVSPPPLKQGDIPASFTPQPTLTLPPSLTPTATLPALSTYTLVFVGEGRGRQQPGLYTIRGDKSGERLLIDSPAALTNPAWSPDGKRIAYISNEKGTPQVFVASANGTAPKQISSFSNAKNVRTPNWSPDGTVIIFSADETGNDELYTVNLDGTDLKRITDNTYPDLQPVFSLDGKSVIYVADVTRKGAQQIFKRALGAKATENGTQLTTSGGQNYSPALSPDGQHIVFISTRERALAKVYTMRADGSDERLYTIGDGDANNSYPVYSPDGKYIAYVSTRNQIDNVYIAPVFEGRNFTQITNASGKSYSPHFLPGF